MMAPTDTTLGAVLEHDRLRVRAARLRRMLAVLRFRAGERDTGDVERVGLQRAIVDFDAELEAISAELSCSVSA